MPYEIGYVIDFGALLKKSLLQIHINNTSFES